MKNLKIVIAGANGFVANNIRKLLHLHNTSVMCMSRQNIKCYSNEKNLIFNDSNNNISSKIKNYDIMINLIGSGKQTSCSNYEKINVSLTKKIINLCKTAKIKKIIYISGLGTSKYSTSGYFISKYRAENLIINSNLDYTIFRSSHMIGFNDPLSTNIINQIKRYDEIKIPGSGDYLIQPIFINDVAQIIFYSFTNHNFTNLIIDLVGPEIINFKKFIKIFKKIKNIKQKINNIDIEKAYYDALHNTQNIYELDDLNLLLGSFTSNHNILKNLCTNISFKKLEYSLNTNSFF